MKLGDKIKLHIERKPMFSDGKPKITDGEFTIIELGSSLPHCFNDELWSGGFTHFGYGENIEGRPDIVLVGKVYLPTPSFLDKDVEKDLHYDNKIVSWEIVEDKAKYAIPGFEDLEESLEKLIIRRKPSKETTSPPKDNVHTAHKENINE